MAEEYTHGIRIPPFQNYAGFMGTYPYEVIPGGPNDAWVPGYDKKYGAFAEIPLDRFLYERLDWSQFLSDVKKLDMGYGPYQLSNPPFLGAGQMLGSSEGPSWMSIEPNASEYNVYGPGHKPRMNRVLRGYIRRRNIGNPGDPRQYARLYFMFNPEHIQRTYVNYLDVPGSDGEDRSAVLGAVNPFASATVEFSLLFDRQVEVAKDSQHPGVLVDLQVFDVLTREHGAPGMRYLKRNKDGELTPYEESDYVAPSGANDSASFMLSVGGPDTGTDYHVAVVLSPNLIFEGLIRGAAAVFEKFSSRMIPTRMTLTLNLVLVAVVTSATDRTRGAPGAWSGGPGSLLPGGGVLDPNSVTYNRDGRAMAANYAKAVAQSGAVTYDNKGGRENWFTVGNVRADCSSFIRYIYTSAPPPGVTATPVLWPQDLLGTAEGQRSMDTESLTAHIFKEYRSGLSDYVYNSSWSRWTPLGGGPWQNSPASGMAADPSAFERAWPLLAPGDVLVKSPSGPTGHIIMITGLPQSNNMIEITHCTPTTVKTKMEAKDILWGRYEYAARPQPKPERLPETLGIDSPSTPNAGIPWSSGGGSGGNRAV